MTDLRKRVLVSSTVRPQWAWHRVGLGVLWALLAVSSHKALAEDKRVYRCPGNLYTDALSAKEARAKDCKTLEGAPITVIQSPLAKSAPASAAQGNKVSSEDQKARDTERRRILEAELKKEEDALAALQKDFNNGQPDRQGGERNYQKYLDRTAELKDAVTRKEADVAALRRELSLLGSDSK